ncbi:o-succinylbenzoate synthase [Mycolicibacterium chitae]|uniref:O-succinylbenzoate-CoA synthase n=1 Tax=Mycolicibacterium chitae TaxID=1792 RepID=A0A3S4RSU0_MYCCI|nr:o-succinylbenzoate synthase [Mycolicibacterium chitae]VEG48045.1 O-succinylbenzoate-CoA synthase [Mycolicibacterium chitae]
MIVQTLIDLDRARIFAIPLADGTGVREGMLIEGPQGWGEFSPAESADPAELARWLTAATEPGTVGWPDAVRGRVPVAVSVPAVAADRAHRLVADSGCRTAEVTVGTAGGDAPSRAADIARVEAVRDALGPGGRLRCRAGAAWDPATAASIIAELARAAGDLDFVAQPCASLPEMAALRRTVGVRIGVDAARQHGAGRGSGALLEAADVVVLDCGPLGGVRRALRVGETLGLPCAVMSSAVSTVGLAGAIALAAALPELEHACGVGERAQLTGDLVSAARSLTGADGYLPAAPMPPGPVPDLLERFAVTDPQRVDRWRRRLEIARSAG